MKTRRDECEKLVTRAKEQQGEVDLGEVLSGEGLAVCREWRGIVMRAVVQGGGRGGALASRGESIAKINSIDK